MRRWLSAAALFSLATATYWAGLPPARAQGGPCRVANKGDSPVARACADGGLVAAKQTMRTLVKQGRAGGLRYECSDCHVDDTNYDRLTPDARDKFTKLLAAARRR